MQPHPDQRRCQAKPQAEDAYAIECSDGTVTTLSRSRRNVVDAIVVGSFTPSVVLDLAGSTGQLAAAGLEVTEAPVASSPAQFRSLVNGELDVALTSPDNVLAYRFSSQNPIGTLLDARIIGAIDRGMGLALYGRRGITPSDLRGATVGVDVPSSGFALALYALAHSLGVDREDYELVALGSTPRRLEALLAGRCDATMLNAGNDLVAEAAGCVRLVGVTDRFAPYLGTVVAVVGEVQLQSARRLTQAMSATCEAIVSGALDTEAAQAAQRRLDLDDDLAVRYVERLRDPNDGLVTDGVVDSASLATLLRLRSAWLPEALGGGEVMEAALAEGSGLVDAG
jgi:ABC-type nitrate/sulfonate/bicarbonate transport system substrate-binding protein